MDHYLNYKFNIGENENGKFLVHVSDCYGNSEDLAFDALDEYDCEEGCIAFDSGEKAVIWVIEQYEQQLAAIKKELILTQAAFNCYEKEIGS